MSSPFFKFKQFTIWHDKCAMKVGTDGVLLGAWAPLGSRILDVGTGSGLIARMLMQRCPEAEVEGIDIDEATVAQAKENGVRAFQARLQDWKSDIGDCYDLIVSNPPYFQNSLKNPDRGRELARHTDSLGYEELIAHSARLLKEEGQLALILPAEAEEEIRNLAARYSLFPTHITRVYSKETKPARRVILAFSRKNSIVGLIEDSLVLEDEKGGRSAAYSKLCEEFYL
ncbi:MAG: methyltransferase [Paludibacteraceae bacterium]|nr:methyltransferase [Paludibacteraceae bacterium]